MSNAITPADYCTSLDMSQRAELHEAMRAAGCERTDWVWHELLDDPEMGIKGQPPELVERARMDGWLADANDYPAYSLGELWCAAVVLANQIEDEDACPVTMVLQFDWAGTENVDHPPPMKPSAGAWCLDGAEEFTHGSLLGISHAPDALAELVISLHAAVKEADDAGN